MLTMLIGFAALGIDVTFALYRHRQMQTVANAAALAGATTQMTGHPADYRVEALAVAAAVGFVNGTGGVTVTVNSPPLSGHYTAETTAVEVTVGQPQTLPLVSLLRAGAWMIRARAVALQGDTGSYCIAALDHSASGALAIQNNASVSSSTCGVAVNSSSSSAMTLANNASVNGPVNVVGGWSLGPNAHLNGHPQVAGASAVADPYSDVAVGTIPACTGQSGAASNNAKVNLLPGHFCSGWSFSNNVELSLAAGTYYVDSQMLMGNNAVVHGDAGVTLIVNGSYAIQVGNNARLSLTAQTTGPFAGLAVIGLNTASSVIQRFANNVVMNITGTVYFRNQIIEFDNNGTTTPGGCTHVIARIVRIFNNVRLDNNCTGTGARSIGGGPSHLVE